MDSSLDGENGVHMNGVRLGESRDSVGVDISIDGIEVHESTSESSEAENKDDNDESDCRREQEASDIVEDDSDDDEPPMVFGASSLDACTGELTYRGGFISPDIDKLSILSVVFADDAEFIDDAYERGNGRFGGVRNAGVFEDCDLISTVEVNATCSSVGSYAFYGLTSIVSVHLGNCTEIHPHAFEFCISLESLVIPGSCRSISEAAFSSCTALTAAHFADPHLITLAYHSFYYCEALHTINLPSLAKIPCACFSGTSLRTVTIPEACREIDNSSFIEPILESIKTPTACENIASLAFRDCRFLTTVILPDTCTFKNDSFIGCDHLKSAANRSKFTVEQLLRYRYRLPRFIIPSFFAFRRCDKLEASTGSDGIGLNVDGHMMVNAFRNLTSDALRRKILGYVRLDIIIGEEWDESDSDSQGGSGSCNDDVYFVDDDNIYFVENFASDGFPDSTSVEKTGVFTYRGGLVNISYETKSSVETAIVEDGVREIADSALAWCQSLTTLKIVDDCAKIGVYALLGCKCLTTFLLPDACTINLQVFYGCTALYALAHLANLSVEQYCRLKWRSSKLYDFKLNLFACYKNIDTKKVIDPLWNDNAVDRTSYLWVMYDMVKSDDVRRRIMEYLDYEWMNADNRRRCERNNSRRVDE